MCVFDFIDICRDEKCSREEIHAAHGPVHRDHGRRLFHVDKRQLVLDAVFGAIGDRTVKCFAQVFTDVVNDYGSLKERTVYRALHELTLQRLVAMVVPPGSAERLRSRVHDPMTGRIKSGFVKGSYIRYDSPLLWQLGGIETLFEQVEDQRQMDEQLSMRRGRRIGANPSRRGIFADAACVN